MMDDVEFRTWDVESKYIRERNIEKTLEILKEAGITPENPNYKRYYTATMINVNNAYRFSYDGETEAMLDKVLEAFAENIKNPNISIDDYERGVKKFLQQRVEKQFQEASGAYASEATYEEMRKKLDETIKSGMEMRTTKKTTFPQEFYDIGSRLVMDIPLEMQEESAMRNIDMIIAKYKGIGVEFSSADNAFIVKGQKVGPEKFFTSKASRLSGFIAKYDKDQTILDMQDDELFGILEKGDYEGFLELSKRRAGNRNSEDKEVQTAARRNEILRGVLKDEVIFREVCSEGFKRELLIHKIEDVFTNFERSAQIVSKESEKDVLGRVDRVVFSIVPEDLATQSTLRNWRSCMHTTGCNHQYVDDSIGVGSIVAYGYDSQNPQKKVSRLLIHPYYDDKGRVGYRVNNRIYGKDNTGFRRAVEKVTQHFNDGKLGLYQLATGLYNDNGFNTTLALFRRDDQGRIILDDFVKDGHIKLDETFQFSTKTDDKLLFPDGIDVVFLDFAIPNGTDLSACKDLKLEGNVSIGENVKLPKTVKISGHISDECDLASVDNLLLEQDVYFGSDIKLPKNIDVSSLTEVRGYVPEGIDLSICQPLTVDCVTCGKNVKLPHELRILGNVPKGLDLSQVKKLTLEDFRCIDKDVKLPQDVLVSGTIPYGADLSRIQHLTLRDIRYMSKDAKLPDVVMLSGHISYGVDLSKVKDLLLGPEVRFDNGVSLPDNVVVYPGMKISGHIPAGMDLSRSGSITFGELNSIGEGVKLPKDVCVSGNISSGIDLSSAENLLLSSKIHLGSNIKFPKNTDASALTEIGGYIPDGTDLSKAEQLTLRNIKYLGKDVKLPEEVCFSENIPDGADLSQVKKLTLLNIKHIGENVKLSQNVFISGNIPDGTDLSGCQHLTLKDSVICGKDVKFPENISFDGEIAFKGYLPDGTDLSGCQHLTLVNSVNFGKDVKLPENLSLDELITFSGYIPEGMDLSSCKSVKLENSVNIGKDVKLPDNVSASDKVVLSGYIPEGMDLSVCKSVTLKDNVIMGHNIKLSETTWVSDGAVISGEFPDVKKIVINGAVFKDISVPENRNLNEILPSGRGYIFEGKCHFADGTKLPYHMTFRDATVSGDLSNISIISNINFTGRCRVETDKLPNDIDFKDAEILSGDFTGKILGISGNTTFSEDVKLSDTMLFSDTYINDGTILENMRQLNIKDSTIGRNVKISIDDSVYTELNNIVFSSGCDLSGCKAIRCKGVMEFAKDALYPQRTVIENATINGDLSSMDSVFIEGDIDIPFGTKLPKEVVIGGYDKTSIKGDLSSAESVTVGHYKELDLSNVTDYPKKMTFKYNIPDGADLRAVKQLVMSGESSIGENVKLADDVEIIINNAQISKEFDFGQYKNVHFEGVTMACDAESLQRLLQSEAKAIVVDKKNLADNLKLPSDKALMIVEGEEAVCCSYIPDEKSRKTILSLWEGQASEEEIISMLNVVDKEEFTKLSGVEVIPSEVSSNVAEDAKKSLRDETPAEKISNTLEMIANTADTHDASGKMKEKIFEAYIKDESKVLGFEFWGNMAQEYALASPMGREACVKDLSKLGLVIGKDVKENQDNPQYQAVKKHCAECKTADEVLHIAKVCAKRSAATPNVSKDSIQR